MTDLDLASLRAVTEAAMPLFDWWKAENLQGATFDERHLTHIATFDPPTVLALIDRAERAEAELTKWQAIAERNGVRWCACSRAARRRDEANPVCPLHGTPMVQQRDALAAKLEAAEANALNDAADAIQALHPGEVKASVEFLRDRAARLAGKDDER